MLVRRSRRGRELDQRADVKCTQDRIPCWTKGKQPSKHLAHYWRFAFLYGMFDEVKPRDCWTLAYFCLLRKERRLDSMNVWRGGEETCKDCR